MPGGSDDAAGTLARALKSRKPASDAQLKTQLNDALEKVQHERDAATEELGRLASDGETEARGRKQTGKMFRGVGSTASYFMCWRDRRAVGEVPTAKSNSSPSHQMTPRPSAKRPAHAAALVVRRPPVNAARAFGE